MANRISSLQENFYGSKVTIQAIVGRNGSGKSSLLELTYRIMNNFSYVATEGTYRAEAERLYYIRDIWAELYYELDGHLGCVKIEDDTVTFIYGQENPLVLYFPGTRNYEEVDGWLNANPLDGDQHADLRVLERHTREEILEKTLSHFFYSLVINYSIQSLNPCDYEDEDAYGEDEDDKTDYSWLRSLYRKNDGYMVPIGFEPYRGDNKIDLINQKELTEDRVAALLIDAEKHHHKILPGYCYSSIDFMLDAKFMVRFEHPADDDIATDAIQKMTEDLDCERCQLFFDGYGINEAYKQREGRLFKLAFMYLIDKTFNVSVNYPDYEDYAALSFDFFDLEHNLSAEEHGMILSLIEKVKEDPSHIGVKVHQTLHFLDKLFDVVSDKQLDMERDGFTYDEYIEDFFSDMEIDGPKAIMEYYPPPIFRNYIYLKNEADQECIEFPALSSGERQYLFTISAYLYHLRNIISVPGNVERVKYRNVCLFLDEIELCFHPEYQRTFVANLLQTLKDNKVTEELNINVILTTHSPFVLSDIPRSNILFLKKGEIDNENDLNPFGANVNDLLAQSFFLENGFVGEFAKEKIRQVAKYLKGRKREEKGWNKDTAFEFIKMVGDPLVKELLLRAYYGRFKEREDEVLKELKRWMRVLENRDRQ